MTLRHEKGHWRGDTLDDLRSEMRRYALKNGYALAVDHAPACACGGGVMKDSYGAGTFFISADHGEGGTMLTCGSCDQRGFVADSQRFMRARSLHEDAAAVCVCGRRDFHVIVGAALYDASRDVRWWYVGGRCVRCGVLGVYVDWKDDGTPWEAALREPAKRAQTKKPVAKKPAAEKPAAEKPATKKPPATRAAEPEEPSSGNTVPSDLARALKQNVVAAAAWKKLAPSHKREHLKHILEAKKPETRARRIEKAIVMLSAPSAKR